MSSVELHPKCTMSQLPMTIFELFFMGRVLCSYLLCCNLVLLQYVGAGRLSSCDHGWFWETGRALKLGCMLRNLCNKLRSL